MSVETNPASFGRIATDASVSVASEAFGNQSSPFLRLVEALPFGGDPSLPGRVARTGMASDSRLGSVSPSDSELVHRASDGRGGDSALYSKFSKRTARNVVLLGKPFLTLVRRVFAIVTRDVSIPAVLLAVPRSARSAAALAHRRIANRNPRPGSIGLAAESIGDCPRLNALSLEETVKRVWTDSVLARQSGDSNPCSIRKRLTITTENLRALCIGEFSIVFSLRHGAHSLPHKAAV